MWCQAPLEGSLVPTMKVTIWVQVGPGLQGLTRCRAWLQMGNGAWSPVFLVASDPGS